MDPNERNVCAAGLKREAMRLRALEQEWKIKRPAQKRSRKKRKLDGSRGKSKSGTIALSFPTTHTPSDDMGARKTAEIRTKQRKIENKQILMSEERMPTKKFHVGQTGPICEREMLLR